MKVPEEPLGDSICPVWSKPQCSSTRREARFAADTRAFTVFTPRVAAMSSAVDHALSSDASTLGMLGDPVTELGQRGLVDVADVHPSQDLAVGVDNDEEQGRALLVLH